MISWLSEQAASLFEEDSQNPVVRYRKMCAKSGNQFGIYNLSFV